MGWDGMVVKKPVPRPSLIECQNGVSFWKVAYVTGQSTRSHSHSHCGTDCFNIPTKVIPNMCRNANRVKQWHWSLGPEMLVKIAYRLKGYSPGILGQSLLLPQQKQYIATMECQWNAMYKSYTNNPTGQPKYSYKLSQLSSVIYSEFMIKYAKPHA